MQNYDSYDNIIESMRYCNGLTVGLTAGLVGIFLIAEPMIKLKEGLFHENFRSPITSTIPPLDHTPHQEYPMKEPIGRAVFTEITSISGNTLSGPYGHIYYIA